MHEPCCISPPRFMHCESMLKIHLKTPHYSLIYTGPQVDGDIGTRDDTVEHISSNTVRGRAHRGGGARRLFASNSASYASGSAYASGGYASSSDSGSSSGSTLVSNTASSPSSPSTATTGGKLDRAVTLTITLVGATLSNFPTYSSSGQCGVYATPNNQQKMHNAFVQTVGIKAGTDVSQASFFVISSWIFRGFYLYFGRLRRHQYCICEYFVYCSKIGKHMVVLTADVSQVCVTSIAASSRRAGGVSIATKIKTSAAAVSTVSSAVKSGITNSASSFKNALVSAITAQVPFYMLSAPSAHAILRITVPMALQAPEIQQTCVEIDLKWPYLHRACQAHRPSRVRVPLHRSCRQPRVVHRRLVVQHLAIHRH